MEAVYYAARVNLRRLMKLHPDWTQQQYGQAVGMSVGWVKKWKKRLGQAPVEDEQVLQSLSRARKQAPERISQQVVDRILHLRDHPPEELGRTPGAKALLYYLPRDGQLQGQRLPRSSRTIYGILKRAGRIRRRGLPAPDPAERPAAMSHWQLDFKDVSSVQAEPEGKQRHVVEVLNVVDVGTSVLVQAQAQDDFVAETTLEAVAALFQKQGVPQIVQFDRDVRFVSSPSGSDFPSALLRFCYCLGVGVLLCEPHHPQQNGWVERYHRSYQQECLARQQPSSLAEVREVTEQFAHHYNWQRPHQGKSCGNLPPRVAFPDLPTLPAVPDVVDPDRWLQVCDGLAVVRRVSKTGIVRVDLKGYYIGRSLAGQQVSLHLSAAKQAWLVSSGLKLFKSLPLTNVGHGAMRFDAFVQFMSGQARAERRLRTAQQRRLRLGASP